MPTPAFSQVGGSNTYIATYGDETTTGNLQVEYSRNIKTFALNRWSENRPVTRTRGFYLRIQAEQAARVLTDTGREFAWPPGADRPHGSDNQEAFAFSSYFTQRRAHSVTLDDRAVEQSAWDVAETEIRAKAQQAMTRRVMLAYNALSGATWGGNTAAVASIAGIGAGKNFGNGTTTNPYLKIALQYAAILINQRTLGVIMPSDLVLVFNPNTAAKISQSQEIISLLSQSVWAYPMLTGTLPGQVQKNWGLPPTLYDFRIAVDDTVRVTSHRGAATTAFEYVIPDDEAYLLARADNEQINPTILKAENGELDMDDDQRANVPVKSTICMFAKEDFNTENNVDRWNRRTEVSIVDDIDFQVTSVLSGFRFTDIFA